MTAFAKGDRVSHEVYGPGTLANVDEYHTVIDFDHHGRRTFVTKMVVLQSTDEPAPARSKSFANAARL